MALRGLVTLGEAARICGMSKQGLHSNYILRGLFLPPMRIGRMNVWDEAEVRKWNANRPKVRARRSRGAILSEKQLKVLSLLAQGLKNLEVAQKLNVHPATISYSKRSAFRRLNVWTIQEAITSAKNLGLL